MSDQPLPWRTQPGLLKPGLSSNESIHTLLGDFLRDRHGCHLGQGSAAPGESDPQQRRSGAAAGVTMARCLASSWQWRCERWLTNSRIDMQELDIPLVKGAPFLWDPSCPVCFKLFSSHIRLLSGFLSADQPILDRPGRRCCSVTDL
jgi:hypothetical protein